MNNTPEITRTLIDDGIEIVREILDVRAVRNELKAAFAKSELDGGDYRAEMTRNYRLDPNVPFGHVYEFPSMEAYELWIERGSPQE